MEWGGVNPKKAASAKRASSQRAKAKHSRHSHGSAPKAAQGKPVAEVVLRSNAERYDDENGSDEAAAMPLGDGEVRSKSKGADYSELLSSDMPKLFEDLSEPIGMTAMLLANGLGFVDWDSSYLQPVSSAAERQAAKDASALLTVDLDLLGKNIALLNVSQRLFLEDELFLNQHDAGDKLEVSNATESQSEHESCAAIKPGSFQNVCKISLDPTVCSGHAPPNDQIPALAFARDPNNFEIGLESSSMGPLARAVKIAVDTPPCGGGQTRSPPGDLIDSFVRSSSTKDYMESQTSGTQEEFLMEKLTEKPLGLKQFESAVAEAELDDLLDMLDKEHVVSPLTNVSLSSSNRNSPSSDFFLPSQPKPSSDAFQMSWRHSGSSKLTSKSDREPSNQHRGQNITHSKEVDWKPHDSKVKTTDVLLYHDGDFETWLDSI